MTTLYSLIIVGIGLPLLIYSAYLLIDGYRFFRQYSKFQKLKYELDLIFAESATPKRVADVITHEKVNKT